VSNGATRESGKCPIFYSTMKRKALIYPGKREREREGMGEGVWKSERDKWCPQVGVSVSLREREREEKKEGERETEERQDREREREKERENKKHKKYMVLYTLKIHY
jgi:hypothetical protein